MRRFRPPWTIEEHNEACFIVKDATDQALAYFYFEEEPGRRSVMGCFSSEAAPSRMTQAALEQLFAPLAGAVEILSIAKHGARTFERDMEAARHAVEGSNPQPRF
jgi:hypothetical protein